MLIPKGILYFVAIKPLLYPSNPLFVLPLYSQIQYPQWYCLWCMESRIAIQKNLNAFFMESFLCVSSLVSLMLVFRLACHSPHCLYTASSLLAISEYRSKRPRHFGFTAEWHRSQVICHCGQSGRVIN